MVLKQDNPSLVLVHPRKTCPCLTERLLMGLKESNQTNKQSSPKTSKAAASCFAVAHMGGSIGGTGGPDPKDNHVAICFLRNAGMDSL